MQSHQVLCTLLNSVQSVLFSLPTCKVLPHAVTPSIMHTAQQPSVCTGDVATCLHRIIHMYAAYLQPQICDNATFSCNQCLWYVGLWACEVLSSVLLSCAHSFNSYTSPPAGDVRLTFDCTASFCLQVNTARDKKFFVMTGRCMILFWPF